MSFYSTPIDEYLFTRAIPEPNSGCWLWLGKLTKMGYASGNAHQRAFKLAGRIVPKGLELDHTCRIRCCINPDHLETVTRSENMLRSPETGKYNRNKTHCLRGHSLTDAYVNKYGHRQCRHCISLENKTNRAKYSERKADWRAKNREHYNAYMREYNQRRKNAS